MAKIIVFFLAVFCCFSCKVRKTPGSRLKFDSAYTVGVDGTITEGLIYTSSKDEATIIKEITEQLRYSIGQLNGIGGVSEIAELKISLDWDNSDFSQKGENQIKFAAQMLIAWPAERDIFNVYPLYVPKGGASRYLSAFFGKYSRSCIQDKSYGFKASNFWYDFRPEAPNCPLTNGSVDNNIALKFDMNLEKSEKNTEGKSPEYNAIWQDGVLEVTIIVAQDEEGSQGSNDNGILVFNHLFNALLFEYGQPSFSSVQDKNLRDLVPGVKEVAPTIKDVQLEFEIPNKGKMDIRLLLIKSMKNFSNPNLGVYNERSMTSDLIIYSGHSGLGDSVRRFSKLGNFQPGKYQVFYINGCDSFAYLDTTLRDIKAGLNPEVPPYKFVDFILNATPPKFGGHAKSILAVIKGLAEAKDTYRQILLNFDPDHRAIVKGEEDNDF